MIKKRDKIDKQEVFDSLLLSFEKSTSDENTIVFRLLGSDNIKSHVKLFISITNKEKYKDKRIILFDPDSHQATIPFFKQQLDSDGKVISFILVMKDFLDNANSMIIENLQPEKNHVVYQINSKYEDFSIDLSFYESDMYPSVSRYIINTAADGIYKKSMKGNK